MVFVPLRGVGGLVVTLKEALFVSLLYCDQFSGRLPVGDPSNDRVVHGDTVGAHGFPKVRVRALPSAETSCLYSSCSQVLISSDAYSVV
jgi:hypothetical protein